MNKSIEIEELNEIFKKIIDSFSSEKFTCISNLTKEENLISVLKEIEPNFEAIGGKLDLSLDSSLGKRYENFVNILKAISNYLDKSKEKDRFLFNTDITKFLNIMEIINRSASQIILVSELLLFICVITSRKNYYIDRIRDLEDTKFVNIFFNKIEKYILLESKEDEYNKSFSELSKSYVGYNSNSTATQNLMKNSSSEFEVYKSTKLLLDQERDNHRKTIKEYEGEISKYIIKAENYEKTIAELEAKLKDCESELCLLKEKSQFSLKAQEESITNSAFNQELKNQLKSKESEIDDIKRKNDLTVKRLNEELFKAKEKNENLEDKLQELNSLRVQNEKLYTKVKELNIYKDKKIEFENLLTTNETKNKQIEMLVKEKQSLLGQIDKLCDDLQKIKEKLSICEYEKKNMEYELQDLKKDFSRLENKQFQNLMNVSDARKSVNFNSNNNNNNNNLNNNNNYLLNNFNSNPMNNNNNNFFGSRKGNNENFILNNSELKDFNNFNINNNNNNNKENEDWVKLNEIGMESVIGDFGAERGNLKLYDLREFQDLISEKNEIMKSLKEQIDQNQSLIMEKDKLSGEINHLKNHIEKLNSENDKILIEKGKLEIFIQKQELELQKNQISFEYESKKFEDALKNLTNKNEVLKSENLKCLQEIENLKYLMANSSSSSGKKLDEIHSYSTKRVAQGVNQNGESPANVSNNNNSSSKRFFFGNKDDNNSTSLNSDSKTRLKISPKNQINLSDGVEVSSLKNEISNLKKIIQQKEELINILTQQIKTLESNDELERYKTENSKMGEDLEFYKRSYEEQNVRVNKEHEIISSSLYDLALQFMTLKSDLHKKMNK